MRLLDFIVNLSKSQSKVYGFSQLLSIVDNVRSLGYDIYSEFNSDKYSEEVINCLHILNSSCQNCPIGRCSNVALPDGFIQSDIFMVTDYPEILDDRLGVIGSTKEEVLSSGCSGCSNTKECYEDFQYQNSPNPSCNYIPLKNISNFKLLSNQKIETPFDVINIALKKAGITRKFNTQQVNKDLNIYITSVFKCIGAKELSFEEQLEESTCQKTWLENERLLSNAPYTIVLGVDTAKLIFGKRRNFKGRTNKIITIDTEIDWKDVIIIDHPRNVEDSQTYISELVDFFEYLKEEKGKLK